MKWCWVALLLLACARRVELEAHGASGATVIVKAGERVVWEGVLDDRGHARVALPGASSYSIWAAGSLMGVIESAERVERIEIDRFHVEAWEPADQVELQVTHEAGIVPRYSLLNRGPSTWTVLEYASAPHGSCLHPGGTLEPGSTLDLGRWDEACFLGDAGSAEVSVIMSRPTKRNGPYVSRNYVARHTVRAEEVVSRWVPGRLANTECICQGSEIGPRRERVREGLGGGLLLDQPDGGVRYIRNGTYFTFD